MNRILEKNNYIIIPNFINSHKAYTLFEEYQKYCVDNNLSGDAQAPNSNSSYNYILFLELLCEKTQEVSSILEEPVLPTYAYSRIYHNGSVLEKHTDRDACEISLTLNLGGDEDWPIFIKTPSGEEKSVILHPGDAMMYLGKIAEHWREKYNGNYYGQVFLHYVRSRGDCSYAYFDNDKNEKEDKNIENEVKTDDDKKNEVSENIKSPTIIVPKPTNTLEQYIHVFDDILSKDFCQEIINEYKNSNEWSDARVGTGMVNKSSRNCNQIMISDPSILEKNIQRRKYIDENIHNNVGRLIQKVADMHEHFNIEIDTGYQLLRYNEGEFYTQHVDSYKAEQRSLSCSIQLNDDYLGGEFGFFSREILIRSAVGSAIVFPSNFMFPHEILPVTEGTRYSIITWLV